MLAAAGFITTKSGLVLAASTFVREQRKTEQETYKIHRIERKSEPGVKEIRTEAKTAGSRTADRAVERTIEESVEDCDTKAENIGKRKKKSLKNYEK